jgi:hypothetical protein
MFGWESVWLAPPDSRNPTILQEGTMSDRNHVPFAKILLTLLALLLWAGHASAYAGPGAGLEFVGYFMGLLIWIGTAFFAMLMWPIYALIRMMRGKTAPSPSAAEAAALDVTASVVRTTDAVTTERGGVDHCNLVTAPSLIPGSANKQQAEGASEGNLAIP